MAQAICLQNIPAFLQSAPSAFGEVYINSHAMRCVSAKNPQNLIKIEELYSATLIESIKGRMLEFLTD